MTPQLLAGAYTLDTISIDTARYIATFTPPQGRGTLLFTDSTYKIYVVEQSGATPADTTVEVSDSGTYSVSASTLTETSLTGQPTVTATASVHSNVLTLQVTSPTLQTTFAWGRVP